MFNNLINAYFLPSSIRLLFSVSLLWLFTILMLSFNCWYYVSSLINVINSSWLISLFINVTDISLSMLFSLLLAIIIILMWFSFLFRVVFNSFFHNCCKNWKCKTRTCTCYPCRCSNNYCKLCNRNAITCHR